MRIAAVVLAAGSSLRMGRPKALLSCRGKSFLRTIMETLAVSGVADVRVVLGDHAEEIRLACGLDEATVARNPRYEDGMLSSVQCGVLALPTDVSAFFLWPVDHPLVQAATVGSILEAHGVRGAGIVLPVHDGRRGHPALFGSRMVAALLSATAAVGARAVVRDHGKDVVEVAVNDPGVVTNIDTPEAYRAVFGTPL